MVRRKRTGNRTFPKRATLWLPFDVSLALVTAGTAVESGDLLGNYFSQTGEEVPVGTTLGPVRARWGLSPNVATSNDRNFKVEALMQLNREGGRATLAIPGVDITDGMWYGQFFNTAQKWETTASTFTEGTTSGPLETKAKRKIQGNGQTLTITGVSNSSIDYNLNVIGHVMLMLS